MMENRDSRIIKTTSEKKSKELSLQMKIKPPTSRSKSNPTDRQGLYRIIAY